MRAEFTRPDSQEEKVGRASWDGSGIWIESGDDEIRAALARIFRPSPVAVDDSAVRPPGTSGPVLLAPGSLGWFQAAARARASEEGLAVRFMPENREVMGWDPAGAYRPFEEAVERMERVVRTGRRAEPTRTS